MEIKDQKFKAGDKVITKKGHVGTVIKVESYHLNEEEYWYDVNCDEIISGFYTESYLDPYVEKPKTVWDLKEGDYYVIAHIDGEVYETHWDGTAVEKDCRNLGNCFLTKEDAEYELERRRIENEMLRLGGRRNFKKGERNWYIYFGVSVTNKNSIGYNYDMDNNDGRWKIYFDSIKDCSNAVNLIGEEKINKYLFGVEE